MNRNIACYLSSHGFGHAVRSETVIRAMALEQPDWRFFVVSGSPPFLFKTLLQLPNVHLRSQATDFGLVQTNPRDFCLKATAEKLKELVGDYGRIVERETSFLAREGIDGIYCDIPFLPFLSASSRNIPSCGMGNFSWDWIYYYYTASDPVFEQAARLAYRCYRKCGLFLMLPFSPEPLAFPRVEPIPLVCRKPGLAGSVVREELGIDPASRVVLIGFSELDLPEKAIGRINRIKNCVFLLPEPLSLSLENGIPVPADDFSFQTLVSACDTILTKAGYGIISDAIAGKKALVTTERGDFPEIPYLNRLIEKTVGQTQLSRKDFEAGRWEKALKKATAGSGPLDLNGTRIASDTLLHFFRTHC